MATYLFRRIASVLVGKPSTGLTPNAIEVTDLDIQFKVTKDIGKQPNTCEVQIYNLKEETRAKLNGKGNFLVLQAGYPGTIEQLFSGDVRFIDHVQQGADYVTKIECGDGERAMRFGKVSQSFKPGTSGKDVAHGIAASMGVKPGNLGDIAGSLKTLQNGYTAHGNAADELDKVLTANGYTWSVQDGALQILKPGQAWKGAVPLIGPDSGLIGSPERGSPAEKGKPQTLKFKALLMPSLRPGGKVKIQSKQFNGPYLLMKVTHTGATAGGDWQSECEALPVSGS